MPSASSVGKPDYVGLTRKALIDADPHMQPQPVNISHQLARTLQVVYAAFGRAELDHML